jgi:hypothetical protein
MAISGCTQAAATSTAAAPQGMALPQNDTASGALQLLRRLLAPSAIGATRSPACTPGLFEGAGRRPCLFETLRIGHAKEGLVQYPRQAGLLLAPLKAVGGPRENL